MACLGPWRRASDRDGRLGGLKFEPNLTGGDRFFRMTLNSLQFAKPETLNPNPRGLGFRV